MKQNNTIVNMNLLNASLRPTSRGNHNRSILPTPNEKELLNSQRLVEEIRVKIKNHHGHISFADYMELALYHPSLGFYSGSIAKFGKEGSFVTAPEISSLFSRCLANQTHEILEQLNNGTILELG